MKDWELILKYIRKEASEAERRDLEEWMNEDPANKELYKEVKNTWDISGKLEKSIQIDKPAAWQSIQSKIKEQSSAPAETTKVVNINWLLRVAAVLIIALFATWLVLGRSEKEALLTTTTGAEKKLIVLSDCTRVFLNANSTFIYPEDFTSNERVVSLVGEAFFDVTKNPEKPFVIKNESFNVKVLGTSFNVSAYEKNSDAVVTVVNGKVAFNGKDGSSVILIKDEVGVLKKSNGQVNKMINSDINFLSWKTKKIEFKNTGFKEVCETINKYFSVEIEIKDENIFKCRFTGYFENPSLEQVLSVLEKTLDVKVYLNNKQVVVTGKGC